MIIIKKLEDLIGAELISGNLQLWWIIHYCLIGVRDIYYNSEMSGRHKLSTLHQFIQFGLTHARTHL